LLNEAGINGKAYVWLQGNSGSGAMIARQSGVGIVTEEPAPEKTTSVQAG
jgi:hypothetical protein